MRVSAVVFDLGGVLVDWDPRHLYRGLFGDEAAMERFLATVCTPAWNERQDAGRPLAAATAALIAEHPAHADLIRAYYDRWPEMLRGAIDGTVAVLEELAGRGVPLYALTNWSAETFPVARARFGFLARFRGVVVSGEEGLKKPDPEIFRRLLARYALVAAETIYVDDVAANVAAAAALGMIGIRFRTPEALRADLVDRGVL